MPSPHLHVLLVEDNRPLAASLKLSLEWDTFRVTVAEDGWTAAYLLGRETFDVLVTDYDLPGLTGSQLCFIARSNPATAELPVIMMTGHGARLDLPWLQGEHKLAAILEKPIKPHELAAAIKDLCAGQVG